MKTATLPLTALAIALATPLDAGPILNNDFEAETVGTFPATGLSDMNESGIAVVEDDTSATPFGAGNQYFHLGQAGMRVRTNIPGVVIDQVLRVGFDLVEPAGVGTNAIRFGFAANATSLDLNDNTAYGLNLNNGIVTTGTNTSVESGSLPTLTEDADYRLELTVNPTAAAAEYPDPTNPSNPALSLDAGRLALWVKDLTAGTWSGPVILTTTQAEQPREFLFRTFSTGDNEIYVDNLEIADAGRWDGEGGDGFWSTAANWTGDAVPTAGDPLVFGAGPDSFISNDLTVGTSFSALSFLSTAGEYTMDGAGITLTGPLTSDSPNSQFIGFPIALGDDVLVTANDGNVFLDGIVSGGFGLEKSGPGAAFLTKLNTYTGGTTVTEGTLSIGDGSFEGEVVGPIVNDATLQLSPTADLEFSNAVSGTGDLRLVGPSTFRLTGGSSYTGETLLEDGILLLDSGSALPAGGGLAFVGTGGELDVANQAVALGTLRSDGPTSATNTIGGTGSLTVTGGDFLVGPGSGSTPDDAVTFDLSGLASFTYDNPTGIVSVGNRTDGGNRRTGVLSLADQSVLTAERIRVQNINSGTAGPCTGVLELGADTTLHTTEIEIAHSGRDSGRVEFRPDLAAGSLTLRAADGTGRAAIDIGRRVSSYHSTHNVGIDLVSGGAVTSNLDALVSTLQIGDINFGNNVVQNAFFRMGGGTLDADSILLGNLSNGGGSNGTLNSIFSVDGGAVVTPTVTFGNNTSPDSTLNASFELNSGSLTATTIEAGGGTGTSSRALRLAGGILANTPGADLTSTDVDFEIPAGSTPMLSVGGGHTATLSWGTARFGIDAAAGTSGTLTVSGDLVLGPGLTLELDEEVAGPLAPGTKLTLIDYTSGTLTGAFEDASAAPINDGDLIVLGFNVFQIDYDDPTGGAMAVTLTVDQSSDTASFVYDVGDRVGGGNALGDDNWTGDDLANWLASGFSGDVYGRNTNNGDDRITRTNDGAFTYGIPSNATSVSLDVTGRLNGNFFSASLTSGGTDVLGLGYDGPAGKFFLLDGTTRIDEAGASYPGGDLLATVRIVLDLTTGTADLIFDPAGTATLAIDDAPVSVDGLALAAADGLAMRTNSRFIGVARYTLEASLGGATNPYDTWASSYGLDPLGNGAPGEDPDGDGKDNRFEFGTNDNPTSGTASGKLAGLVQDVGGDAVLTFTLPVRGSGTPFSGTTEQVSDPVDGLVYRIQGSDDLEDWTSMVVSEVTPALDAGLPDLDPGWEYRTFRTPGTIDGDTEDFLRAVIESNP